MDRNQNLLSALALCVSWMRVFFGIALLSSTSLYANYAWIPGWQHMWLAGGFDWLSSGQNDVASGQPGTPIVFQGDMVTWSRFRFFLEPEYGVAPDWAVHAKFQWVNSSISSLTVSQGAYLSGAGFGDTLLGIKRKLLFDPVHLTGEVSVTVPGNGLTPDQAQQLLLGNGAYAVSALAHLGYTNRFLYLAASPGVIFRFQGYAPALSFESAGGVAWRRYYALLTNDLGMALTDALLFDPNNYQHTTLGTGGTYGLLSGSPSFWAVGLRAGVRVAEKTFVEGFLKNTLWGVRTDDFVQLGLRAVIALSLHPNKEHTIKVHAIPLHDETPSSNPPWLH